MVHYGLPLCSPTFVMRLSGNQHNLKTGPVESFGDAQKDLLSPARPEMWRQERNSLPAEYLRGTNTRLAMTNELGRNLK